MAEKSDYERQREERIARNQQQLQTLNVPRLHPEPKSKPTRPAGQPSKKRASLLNVEPVRRSTRQRKDVDYSEAHALVSLDDKGQGPSTIHRTYEEPATYHPVGSRAEDVVQSSVDPSSGSRDERGRLVFDDAPDFRPTMTPKEVIQAGSFGGIYFNPRGGRPGIISPQGVDIDATEFPSDWFEGLEDDMYKARRYIADRNKYKVKAGQNQADWEKSGWIAAQDPRGWFHWYCRFYQGRRSADDERQIGRWARCAGDMGRWRRSLIKKVIQQNKHWNDATVSPVIRQSLLHWAYELTEEDFNRTRQEM
ncbi:hypothetical protein ABBQ32_011267 [Trebouxia sp. C0010 RCD-2024]